MYLDVYGDTLCALVAASSLASSGNNVCLHVPGLVGKQLAEGVCPFREPGLDELMSQQQAAGRLTLSAMEAMPSERSRIVWLALSPGALPDAQKALAALPKAGGARWLVVNQSTFPVGSSESLQQFMNQNGHSNAVVSLPDLLTEGNALQGFMRAESWLLGADESWARELVAELLRPFNRRRDSILYMRPREAEFTKLAITGMLATRLSYMNDMANLADRLDVDIERVRLGMGADPRIGESYLYPGCGFGGLSFSRDVMSLASTLQGSGQQAQLLEEVLRINERQKEALFRKLWRYFGTDLRGRQIGIWGAAFKPESARIDNSPVLKLLEALWAQGVKVRIHDPRALPALQRWSGERDDLELCDDLYDAVDGVDALMLVTEWKAYWSPDLRRMKELMATPLLLDGRNAWDPTFVKNLGFEYYGIGRR